jgi:hypothetical protein
MEAAMASSVSAFFGGVATVAVALGIGFAGGLYLTDTSLMNGPVGPMAPTPAQPKPAPAPESKAAAPMPAPAPVNSADATAGEKNPVQASVEAPSPLPPDMTTSTAPKASDRVPKSGPPFAQIPEDAHAAAAPAEEERAKAQRQKAAAAQKDAEQHRRAERRRLERAARLAADQEMKAAMAARDRARHRYGPDDGNDEPRGFVGFASGREPDRRPNFFGIPLFGD